MRECVEEKNRCCYLRDLSQREVDGVMLNLVMSKWREVG